MARHIKTPPFAKGGVWTFLLLALALLFVTWRIAEFWFLRDSILQAAPQDTVLAIQFELTEKTWPQIQNLLNHVPLISNRSLVLNDLAAFTQGEIALFITKTGERAVAIRANESQLPKDLLNALSIAPQQVTPDIFLLSSMLLPVGGIHSSSYPPLFFSVSKRWLGRVEIPDMDLSGSLYETDTALEVVFPHQQNKDFVSTAALPQIMLALTAQDIDGSLVANRHLREIYLLVERSNWSVFIENNELGTPEFLLSASKEDMKDTDLLSLLQAMGAFLTPKLNDSTLPDGTTMKEIIVDPTVITVEEVQLGQTKALRVFGPNNQAVYGAFIEDRVVFATSEESLHARDTENASVLPCIGNALHIEPEKLLSAVREQAYQSSYSALQSILAQFSAISIEMNKYSSVVTFCSI